MKTLSRLGGALAVAAGAALSLGSSVASAQVVNFQGSTDGCFGMACVPATGTATWDGLTFSDSTFNVNSAMNGKAAIGNQPGTPNFNNLGSFTLSGSPFDYPVTPFSLKVTFTAPSGTSPDFVIVSSSIDGSVISTDNGGIFVDFDNTPQAFVFDAGTFNLFLNDISLTAGYSIAVSGRIEVVTTPIPEPETYALMMAGLAAVGFMSRRRKKA